MKYTDKSEFEKANMFGNRYFQMINYAQYFIGDSFLNFLLKPGEAPLILANVTFEPACRNNWHIHHAKTGGGQILICTAGEGWYQKEGEEPQSLKEGFCCIYPHRSKTLARGKSR